MSITLVQDVDELRKHQDAIGGLFEAAFCRPLDRAEWEWLFGQNPNGPALVALWHEGTRLVGHTALVPFAFTDGTACIRAYRSGTTMIDPGCEVPGLMALLGRQLQRRAADEGAVVFGFPNNASWLGFKRFLRWTILEGHFADILGSRILANPASFIARHSSGEYALDMDSRDQVEWRLSRPTVQYTVRDGLITSWHEGVEQVLHLGAHGVDSIDPNITYRVYEIDEPALGAGEGRTYRFGHWIPPGQTCDGFGRPELIWSDVF